MNTESLFINTLAFEFPTKPKTFYFSKEDREGVSLTKLSHQLFPCNIEEIFPDISNSDTIYTSFDWELEGFLPLEIDFKLPDNYYLVKRFYNKVINHYLACCNLIVEPNRITKDNQIWIENNTDNKRKDCNRYDRFTLKVDFDVFNKRPHLVLSYDRRGLIYKSSVKDFLSVGVDDPFEETDKPNPSLGLVKHVLYIKTIQKEDGKSYDKYRIDKYKYLAEKFEDYNTENAYPIINNDLARFLGFDDVEDEEEEENKYFRVQNKYTRYLAKITSIYTKYLNNDKFRAIVPISKTGFDAVNPLQIGHTFPKSKELAFGFDEDKKRKVDYIRSKV